MALWQESSTPKLLKERPLKQNLGARPRKLSPASGKIFPKALSGVGNLSIIPTVPLW
jgi:hypothetical protein